MTTMRTERELYVTLIMAAISLIVIVGGFASFTGLSVQQDTITIIMAKESFAPGDVFDVDVRLGPVTFISDESIIISVNGNAVGVIALKNYLDQNKIDYGREIKNLGQNDVEIINLKEPLRVNLADYISLEYMHPGTTNVLRTELSRGDAAAEAVFSID